MVNVACVTSQLLFSADRPYNDEQQYQSTNHILNNQIQDGSRDRFLTRHPVMNTGFY